MKKKFRLKMLTCQDELEAFAAFTQSKNKLYAKRKGKGKGKGKGKHKQNSDAAGAPPSSTHDFKASGTFTFTEQQKAERKRRIALVKMKTSCAACGRTGHWQGDAECTKGGGKRSGSKGNEASGYFMCVDKDYDGLTDVFVATPVRTVLDPDGLCQCVNRLDPLTSANGAARWVDCGTCKLRLWTATRRPGTDAGTSRWIYFMLVLFLRRTGKVLMNTAAKTRALLLATTAAGQVADAPAPSSAAASASRPGPRRSWPAAPYGVRSPAPSVGTWKYETAVLARQLLLSVPPAGVATDQEVADLSDEDLANAVRQFRHHVETTIGAFGTGKLANTGRPRP
jgi:hypothetical protein